MKYEKISQHYEIDKKIYFPRLCRKLIGKSFSDGLIYQLLMYFLLIVIGFIFVYPILYMLSVSMMSNVDLVDYKVGWIPTKLFFDNYKIAFRALNYFKALGITVFLSGISTITLAASSSLIGYGLARFDIPGKKVIFALLLFTYIMPNTLFFIPTYQIYTALKIKGKLYAILLPAITGQGIQGAFFIIIFYQFFKMLPKTLEEAAIIDGANSFKIFYKIAIPMAVPAFIITFVYAFSLYWNETSLYTIYLDGKYQTLPILLGNFKKLYQGIITGDSGRDPNLKFTEAKNFAATILTIIPLIILYGIVQRWFVESIDKSGLTGE